MAFKNMTFVVVEIELFVVTDLTNFFSYIILEISSTKTCYFTFMYAFVKNNQLFTWTFENPIKKPEKNIFNLKVK